MKKHFLFILTILTIQSAFSQHINYQKTYSETLALAAKTNKPIFIHLVVDNEPVPGFPEVLDSKSVVSFYNSHFINYLVIAADSAGVKINDTFHPDKLPANIFLDRKGNIVYQKNGYFEFPEKYLDIANTALQRSKSTNTISYFQELDKQGKLNIPAQFKAYINLRSDFGLDNDQALLDRMVESLTIKDLNDYNTVLYILQAGPIVNGKTYNIIYANRKLVDSVFKRETMGTRVDIEKRIITNSRNLAIKNKDLRLAESSAGYARGTWGNDYKKAYNTYTNEMLIYYKAVKDTLSFYNTAGYYYDQTYLSTHAPSEKRTGDTLDALKPPLHIASTTHKDTVIVKQVEVKGTPYSAAAATLNTAAWDFYILGTHNVNYLTKALMWSKRSTELQPTYSYYDTMAHLLYRLNFKDEAVLNQEKAIGMATYLPGVSKKEQGYLRAELEKMKTQTL